MNIISPINSLGYGVAGLNIVKAMSELETVALWVVGNPEVTTQQDANIIRKALGEASVPRFDDPCLRIWHQHDMSQFVGKGMHIGFPFFELDKFREQEKLHLNHLDRLFVSSQWAKDIAVDQLFLKEKDIRVIPLGVDSEVFKPVDLKEEEKTIFFNCGKWEIRKGHDILVNMFNKAFEKDDDVELWMMTSNPFLTEKEDSEWKNMYLNSKLGDKIKFIDRQTTHEEVYNIMCQTTCGVFPSRAEGWNLELLEMMSCGKQVIATNYSAHTEFCNNDNAMLVDVEGVELAYDGKWFHGKSGSWAKITDAEQDILIDMLKTVHANHRFNKEGVETGKQFSWRNTAKSILSNVK